MKQENTVFYRRVQPRISQSVHDYFAARGKDGLYRKNLHCAMREFCRKPTMANLKSFHVHLLRMLLGDRLMNAALSDRAIVRTGVYCMTGENAGLYHIAPSDCVETILLSGLLPRDRYVYLTDAPEWFANLFLPWKTNQLRASTAYSLLYVDVQRLSTRQKVYYTDRPHEFVTGKIDAAYISLVSEGR